MVNRKTLVGPLVVFLLILTACGDSPLPVNTNTNSGEAEPESTAEQCTLKYGWDPWEPYQYLTPEDEVKGLDIELVTAMAKGAGCNVEFVQDNWVNLLNGIRNGSIEMLGGATITEARGKFALFSDNYRHESFLLYIRTDEPLPGGGTTLSELLEGGFRLGVTEDYLYGEEVDALQDNENFSSQIVSVPITEVNYYNLIQDQIDGFLEDPFVAAYTIRRKGLDGQIEPHSIEIHSGGVSIIFSRKSVNPETVMAFNKALEQMKETGEYQRILGKYSH